MSNEITGRPEAIYCKFCDEYIPSGEEVADILGRDACLECEKKIIALAQYIALRRTMTIFDYDLESKTPGAGPGVGDKP